MSKRRKHKTYPAAKKKGIKVTTKTESTTPATPMEFPSETVGNTRRWARQLHGSQKDKQGAPYINHLDAVMHNLYRLVGWDPELLMAALLHDSVEDTGVKTSDLLEAGYTKRTVDTIYAVTKLSGEANYNYVSFVIESGADAMLVKLADLYHNANPERLAKVTPVTTQDRLRKKYFPAIWRIERALIAHGFVLTPTVTFEEAMAAVRTTTVGQCPETPPPPSPSVGDYVKFNEGDTDGAALKVKAKKTTAKGVEFSFHDTTQRLLIKNGERVWVKWGSSSTSTTSSATWTPEWIKYMGLPMGWKDGDDLPDAHTTFDYSPPTKGTYTASSSGKRSTTKTAPPPPPKATDAWNTGGGKSKSSTPPPAKPQTLLITQGTEDEEEGFGKGGRMTQSTFDELIAEVDRRAAEAEVESHE